MKRKKRRKGRTIDGFEALVPLSEFRLVDSSGVINRSEFNINAILEEDVQCPNVPPSHCIK